MLVEGFQTLDFDGEVAGAWTIVGTQPPKFGPLANRSSREGGLEFDLDPRPIYSLES